MTRLRLTLFMSRRMSLARWDGAGMLDRELALYRRLAARGIEVGLLSWGGREEQDFPVDGIRVLNDRWGLRPGIYERAFPILHAGWLARRGIYKTNQVDIGRQALAAARLWRKPLVARCGYLWSDFRARAEGPHSPGAAAARDLEAALFAHADRVVVTTDEMAASVAARVPAAPAARVVPNYVDTSRFRPDPARPKDRDVLFVGRLAEQKNLPALLRAVDACGASLVVVGDGPEAGLLDGRPGIEWHRRVPHEQLPALMHRCRTFMMPSRYEGHPKALIEAMACGMAVIATDAPGISGVVRDGVDGRLVAEGDLAAVLAGLLADPSQAGRLGQAARDAAVARFSLDAVVEQEMDIYRELAEERRWRG
ncbi:MAG: glycosyltransferase family 4 protein [Actinomycetota bacterium]